MFVYIVCFAWLLISTFCLSECESSVFDIGRKVREQKKQQQTLAALQSYLKQGGKVETVLMAENQRPLNIDIDNIKRQDEQAYLAKQAAEKQEIENHSYLRDWVIVLLAYAGMTALFWLGWISAKDELQKKTVKIREEERQLQLTKGMKQSQKEITSREKKKKTD